MNHTRWILILISVMLPLLGHAQQVAYDYDASGNRTGRSLMTVSQRAAATDDVLSFSAAPNPVSDILQITYEEDAGFSGEFKYTLQGVFGDTAVTGVSNTPGCKVDVSGLPQGVYILHIIYKEKEQSIKIIKK